MKLIIDIDDYDLEWIRNGYCIPLELNIKTTEMIMNGIPLDNAIKEAQAFLDEGDIREFEGNMRSGHHVFDIFIKHTGKERG